MLPVSWRTAWLPWLCALAIAFQCIVVQGHVHPASQPGWAAEASDLGTPSVASNDQHAIAQAKHANRAPTGCFLCEQMALAGAAILPASDAPALLVAAPGATPLPPTMAAPRAIVSHAWRSRAPPVLL